MTKVSQFGRIKIYNLRYNTRRMDTIIENDVKFYNLRKLAEAKRVGGDDFTAVLAHYEKLAGKYDVLEAEKPAKKVVKKTKKSAAKKTS